MAFFSKLFGKKQSTQEFPPQQFRPRVGSQVQQRPAQAQQGTTPRKRSGLPSGYLNKSVF